MQYRFASPDLSALLNSSTVAQRRRAAVAGLLVCGVAGTFALAPSNAATPGAETPAPTARPAVVAPVAASVANPTFGIAGFSVVAKPKPAAPAAGAASSAASAAASDRTEGGASRSTARTSRVNGTGLTGLTANASRVLDAVTARFGQITNVIGVRPDSIPDHPSGRAVDFMIPDWSSTSATGDAVAAYVIANAGSWNVDYIIWRQRIWQNGAWRAMADRGSPTANHMDHVHVSVR